MLTRAVCAPIRLYRAVTAGARPHCRYWPSCSQYALESIELHGPQRGLWLAAKRIGRCHPWGGSGVDPVPEPQVRGSGPEVRGSAPQVRGSAPQVRGSAPQVRGSAQVRGRA